MRRKEQEGESEREGEGIRSREALLKGCLSTVDLLVLTLFRSAPFYIYLFYKTSYFNEEVNCTEPSSLASVPCKNVQTVMPAVT